MSAFSAATSASGTLETALLILQQSGHNFFQAALSVH
jgi:hypothetical protein